MNPTIENLNDPEWWSQYAPEGATHVMRSKRTGEYQFAFYKNGDYDCDSRGYTSFAVDPEYDHRWEVVAARPTHSVDPAEKVGQKHDTGKPKMSELYPKYYKDFSGIDHVDVYVVHDRFQINDPSGCIQHASKKLLLCGVRTGGKDMATEIKEARDTLTRKLQLMGVE